MPEQLVTKRLHVSGLTAAISPSDIQRRLSAFGTVKAMDGFGARDALGGPRKFAFVTIEATAKDLARCSNVLSGSTWKGAKLRIGDAKPDFRQRIAHLNSLSPPSRQKRARARNHGHISSTLPLTPLPADVAAKTPGWAVTPSGRVVRPMKMRPERPLPPMPSTASEVNAKKKATRRVKPPPARARRRTIDPTKWGSTYLTGVFVDATVCPSSSVRDALGNTTPLPRKHSPSPSDQGCVSVDLSGATPEWETSEDDNELDDSNGLKQGAGGTAVSASALIEDEEPEARDIEMADADPLHTIPQTCAPPAPLPSRRLKDLFAPRDEQASFSLLGHLDLDLELEDDAPIIETGPASNRHSITWSSPSPTQPAGIPTSTPVPTNRRPAPVTIDPSRPLLFPLPEVPSYSSASSSTLPPCYLLPIPNIRQKDLRSLPPSRDFMRSPDTTSESIRAQWENEKVELTRAWKKAWKEARKSRKGRGERISSTTEAR